MCAIRLGRKVCWRQYRVGLISDGCIRDYLETIKEIYDASVTASGSDAKFFSQDVVSH